MRTTTITALAAGGALALSTIGGVAVAVPAPLVTAAMTDGDLVGQLVDDRPGDGEPAEARVEDADRRRAPAHSGASPTRNWLSGVKLSGPL